MLSSRVWLVTFGLALLCCRAPAHAEPTPCRAGISRETTERLFALLNHSPAEPDCRFEGVQTDRSRLVARWSHDGDALPPVTVVPRECAPNAVHVAGVFAVDVAPEIAQRCPSVAALIADFEKQVAGEAPAGQQGSESDPLFRGARVLFAVIIGLVVVLAVRGAIRPHGVDRRWLALGLSAFAGALALRIALPFSLGNWYSEVLPASGPPPWMRFGPGFFALQSLLRDAGIWNARTLAWSQMLLGAAAAPLFVALLRELRVGLSGSAAAVVLLILAPFHARLSATTSEHVLASTLCLVLLLAWMRAARRRDLMWLAAALLLFPAVCATRVDMSVQAALVLPWPLLRDAIERRDGRHTNWWVVVIMTLVATTALFATYQLIALPSQHPIPDREWFRFALRYFIPQFWWLSTTDPGWISLSSVLLAGIGLVAMTVQRPLLFVRVATTLAVAFIVSGHTFMHDELVGARYFLFLIPVFLIASGYGFGALLAIVPRDRRVGAATAALLVLAAWTALAGRGAYAARYAFQDEYSFARTALAQLPSGCSVYQERIRADALPGDLDCCLDLARSPLVLDFPALRFLDLPDHRDAIFSESPCTAYYEGVACAIVPGPPDRSGHQFAQEAAAYFQPRCAAVHRRGRLTPVAEIATSSRTTRGLFADERPRVRLYRWTP